MKQTRGPGRPRQIEKRLAIVESARKTFGAHGYNGVSMDKIAIQAGVHKASLVHYFGSKEGLYWAAAESLVAELMRTMAPLFEMETDHRERLERVADVVTGYFLRRRDAARMLLREGIGDGPGGGDSSHRVIRDVSVAVQTFIQSGIAEGAFVDQDTQAAFLAIGGYLLVLYGAPQISRDVVDLGQDEVLEETQKREAARLRDFMVRLLCPTDGGADGVRFDA